TPALRPVPAEIHRLRRCLRPGVSGVDRTGADAGAVFGGAAVEKGISSLAHLCLRYYGVAPYVYRGRGIPAQCRLPVRGHLAALRQSAADTGDPEPADPGPLRPVGGGAAAGQHPVSAPAG